MTSTTGVLIARPNPPLAGMMNAKQARYAAERQAHTSAWFRAELDWLKTAAALAAWHWIRNVAT